jgi:hypothetical protein
VQLLDERHVCGESRNVQDRYAAVYLRHGTDLRNQLYDNYPICIALLTTPVSCNET